MKDFSLLVWWRYRFKFATTISINTCVQQQTCRVTDVHTNIPKRQWEEATPFCPRQLQRLLLPCGDGGPKDRATLWAESDSWPVRSSEPGCCTPQGRTGHHDNEPSQRGWRHIREDTNHTKQTVGALQTAAGTKTHYSCWRAFLSQRQHGNTWTVQRLRGRLLIFNHNRSDTQSHRHTR